MMRLIVAVLICLMPVHPQISGRNRITGGVACVAPSATARWTAYNPANTCTTSCSTGNTITTLADLVGSNNAIASTSHAVKYDGSDTVNGLATMQLGLGGCCVVEQSFTSALSNTGSMTLYVVVKPATNCTSSNCVIMENSNGTAHSFGWYIPTTLKQTVFIGGGGTVGNATTAITTSAYATIEVEYNFSTGATSFYKCSGGSCTVDGTFTSGFTTNAGNDLFGSYASGTNNFFGRFGEIGYFNSVSSTNRSQIAAWSQCKYGI